MKAEVVYGKLLKVEDSNVTLSVKEHGETIEASYPCDDTELTEELIAVLLGQEVKASVIDGRIKKITST